MRQELVDPLNDNPVYGAALALVRRIYMLLNAREDCSEELTQLSAIADGPVSRMEIEDAAELISPEDYAFELIAEQIPVPRALSEDEMAELVERILANADRVVQLAYWTRCLEVNTGDAEISTLIQSPAVYFDDPRMTRRLSAREILKIARAAGRQRRNNGK